MPACSRRPAALLLALATSLLLASCGDSSNQTRLTVTGSSTVAPLMAEIALQFEKNHPDVRVDVQTGGSSRGVADARRGLADIGMASRALNDDESDLTAHTIAYDGIGMIVHADNPVRALSPQQIIDIYQGRIDNWQAVGGPDAQIIVVNKAQGRSTLEIFLEHFELAAPSIKADVVIGDNEQGIKTVAGNPYALGYVSIGAAEYAVGADEPLRLLPLEGVEASTANVRNQRYPMRRPLNLVTRGPLEGPAAALVAHAQSSSVDPLIRQLYFVIPQR
ncbi:MAG: ABC transporter substrate-binding protein [Salinisphaeraceae bacterium]|nr:ABC transporter substrate-binding protein [Salinisphaeraceae bacterium]